MRPELGTIEVMMWEGETTELDLDAMVPISKDLITEFRDQASLYAYVAMMTADAEALWLEAKMETAEVKADTDKEVRQDLLQNGEKVTEDKVKAEVEVRRGYKECKRAEIDARAQMLILRAVERSLDQRAQMLISLGAHLRAEADQTGMLIKDTKETLQQIKEGKRTK